MFEVSESTLREAARALCLERGLDPDARVSHSGRFGRVAQWELAQEELSKALTLFAVIANYIFKEPNDEENRT